MIYVLSAPNLYPTFFCTTKHVISCTSMLLDSCQRPLYFSVPHSPKMIIISKYKFSLTLTCLASTSSNPFKTSLEIFSFIICSLSEIDLSKWGTICVEISIWVFKEKFWIRIDHLRSIIMYCSKMPKTRCWETDQSTES